MSLLKDEEISNVIQSIDHKTLQKLIFELVKEDSVILDAFMMKMRLKTFPERLFSNKKPLQWNPKQILSHLERILHPLDMKRKIDMFTGEKIGWDYKELLESIGLLFEVLSLDDALTILTILTEPVVNRIVDITNSYDEGQGWNEAFNLLGQYWEQFALHAIRNHDDLSSLSRKVTDWRKKTEGYTLDPFSGALRAIHFR